ncbi:DUF4350 domain-containing protein [Agromyces sp. Marseille-P2726]|uniref:DUF4350 domain-containing protein n=1 Tax=Agromyces sp. Marseille-P2726 TaxID=2709132 RepID=UPI001C2D2F8C|nr:DUF4350 domain-containing protein [Agromyces sp. Marseille-P2726]
MTASQTATRPPQRGGPSVAPPVTPTFRAFLRRHRAWIVIAAVLVVGAFVVLIVQGGVRGPGVPLGPDNPAPAGAKAVVEVLRAEGVDILDARSADVAVDAARHGATVFLFDEFGLLADDRLTELAEAADRLVVARPGFSALEAIAPGVRLGGAATGPLDEVACELPPAERAGALSDGQQLLTIDDDAEARGWRGCFRDGDFGFAAATGSGPGGSNAGDLTLVAATTVFENEHVAEAGNAAFALGLLGASETLVWYLPGPGDSDAAGAPSLAALPPGWVGRVMVLAIAAPLAAAIGRGRRFGPRVVETLPVRFPAGETSGGRARLYARNAARGHALDQLRIGTIERLTALLKLPRSASVDEVSDAAAASLGRDAASVTRLLAGDPPRDDRELVTLAGDLEHLERDVRETLRRSADDHTDPTGRRT